jgi:hypothetical protein
MKTSRVCFALVAAFAVFDSSAAAQKPKTAPHPRPGQYACVFAFGGQFFDTKPITIQDGNKYQTSSGDGTWRYEPATSRIRFQTGVLARDYPFGQYVDQGPVRGGLKNKKGPAVVLQPSASYKKRQGQEAVSQYCYLTNSNK